MGYTWSYDPAGEIPDFPFPADVDWGEEVFTCIDCGQVISEDDDDAVDADEGFICGYCFYNN